MRLNLIIGFVLCVLCSHSFSADKEHGTIDLLIVAGQSNAVGYDAKPSELPPDEADREILFWWRCGDPPPDDHDTNSGRKWSHLQPQPLGNPKRPKQGRQYGNFAQPEGGFGPEIGLARTLYNHANGGDVPKRLAVIKVAFSGTNLRRDWNQNDPGDAGACYRALVSETQDAIAQLKEKGHAVNIRAFVWVQGESDANANDSPHYADALEAMISKLRSDLQAPKCAALIAVNTHFGNGKNKWMPVIVEQQKKLASRDPLIEYVDTSKATIANAAHFDSIGTINVGKWCAESLLKLESTLEP